MHAYSVADAQSGASETAVLVPLSASSATCRYISASAMSCGTRRRSMSSTLGTPAVRGAAGRRAAAAAAARITRASRRRSRRRWP